MAYTDPLTEALARYAVYQAAEQRILKSQAYALAGRSTTFPQLLSVQKKLDDLDLRIQRLQARAARGGIRVRGAVPL